MESKRLTTNIYTDWGDKVRELPLTNDEKLNVFYDLWNWLAKKKDETARTANVEMIAPTRRCGNPKFRKGQVNPYGQAKRPLEATAKVEKSGGIKKQIKISEPPVGEFIDVRAAHTQQSSTALENTTQPKSDEQLADEITQNIDELLQRDTKLSEVGKTITCYNSDDVFIDADGTVYDWTKIKDRLKKENVVFTHFDPQKFFRHCKDVDNKYKDGRPLDWNAVVVWAKHQEEHSRYERY